MNSRMALSRRPPGAAPSGAARSASISASERTPGRWRELRRWRRAGGRVDLQESLVHKALEEGPGGGEPALDRRASQSTLVKVAEPTAQGAWRDGGVPGDAAASEKAHEVSEVEPVGTKGVVGGAARHAHALDEGVHPGPELRLQLAGLGGVQRRWRAALTAVAVLALVLRLGLGLHGLHGLGLGPQSFEQHLAGARVDACREALRFRSGERLGQLFPRRGLLDHELLAGQDLDLELEDLGAELGEDLVWVLLARLGGTRTEGDERGEKRATGAQDRCLKALHNITSIGRGTRRVKRRMLVALQMGRGGPGRALVDL